MILRWIKIDPSGKKPLGIRRHTKEIAGAKGAADELGESEFNAILEEVCNTVMPRQAPKKPPLRHNAGVNKPLASSKNKSNIHGQEIPWSTLFLKLSEETTASLTQALAGLQEIALLHPNVAPAIANVTDQLDHARRVAMIAKQFTQSRGARALHTKESLSLRQVVSDAIMQRARWLHRRKVKVRLGLLDARIQSNSGALNSLIDELINWAGGIAKDIDFAVREPSSDLPMAQLLVIARVNTAILEPDQWQNVGWFIWHQLASSLGAKAELQVTQEALSVTVDFATPPPASSLQNRSSSSTRGKQHSQLDTDVSTIIAGCRVLLLLGQSEVHSEAHRAVSRLGLRVSACASVGQARVLLGLDANSLSLASSQIPSQTLKLPLPHAIVFDACASADDMMALRGQIAANYPERKMAFVELSDHLGSDFHVSHMGDASTAHVSLKAIPQSLAPALVFELCKVI